MCTRKTSVCLKIDSGECPAGVRNNLLDLGLNAPRRRLRRAVVELLSRRGIQQQLLIPYPPRLLRLGEKHCFAIEGVGSALLTIA